MRILLTAVIRSSGREISRSVTEISDRFFLQPLYFGLFPLRQFFHLLSRFSKVGRLAQSLGGTCQQPGSPGCPQQLLRLCILIQLLCKSSRTLRPKGMGAWRLVKKEVMLGRWLVTARYPLAALQPDSPYLSLGPKKILDT